jgi:Arc/MetJ-type ribon-helix-helix transcriptional regulator
MPSSYNLPELVKKEIDALVRAGYYSSKSYVVKDALRTFLYSKRSLRLAAAARLYKDESHAWQGR